MSSFFGSRIAKALVASVVFAGIALGARDAEASYLCSASFRPSTGSGGTDGYVLFTAYSSPNCGGTAEGSFYLCSAGATMTSCANATRYQRQDLLATIGMMQRAMMGEQRITVSTIICIGGSPGCASAVNFLAD